MKQVWLRCMMWNFQIINKNIMLGKYRCMDGSVINDLLSEACCSLFHSGWVCPHGSSCGTFLGSHADRTTPASMPACCFSWIASPYVDSLVMSLAVNSSKGRPCFSPDLLCLSLSAFYRAGTQYLPDTGRHFLILHCSNTSHLNVPGSLSPEPDLLKGPYW
jgi:hypothetical protein